MPGIVRYMNAHHLGATNKVPANATGGDVTRALTRATTVAPAEWRIVNSRYPKEHGDNAREWVSRDRTWAHNAARYRDAYARVGAT